MNFSLIPGLIRNGRPSHFFSGRYLSELSRRGRAVIEMSIRAARSRHQFERLLPRKEAGHECPREDQRNRSPAAPSAGRQAPRRVLVLVGQVPDERHRTPLREDRPGGSIRSVGGAGVHQEQAAPVDERAVVRRVTRGRVRAREL
jgi:hypothetical protein